MEDHELRQSLADISRNVTETRSEATKAITLITSHVDTDAENHESTRRDMAVIRDHVVQLYRKVGGSDPPPPPPNGGGAANGKRPAIGPPLDEVAQAAFTRSSHNSLETAALESRMINGFKALETKFSEILKINEAQSRDMGIKVTKDDGKDEPSFLRTREGQRFVLRMMTAFCALVAAVGTLLAAYRGGIHSTPAPMQAQAHAPPAQPPVHAPAPSSTPSALPNPVR